MGNLNQLQDPEDQPKMNLINQLHGDIETIVKEIGILRRKINEKESIPKKRIQSEEKLDEFESAKNKDDGKVTITKS